MVDLYPPVEPFETGLLPVTDDNVLYWESVGDGAGHGGGTFHEEMTRALNGYRDLP